MSVIRVKSSPEFTQDLTTMEQQYDDSALEGVAAHVKLLLKLIQGHKNACGKEKNDGRIMLRVATMMTILDTVRTRIQNCQSFGNKIEETHELRRCNSDLKVTNKKINGERAVHDNERLRRELGASLVDRKRLQIMCSSLGKEKEIMAAELSRKAQELSGMEELISDLKAQNETLLEKVQECAKEHKDKTRVGCSGVESQVNTALQERNNVLSEQLLRSLDGYRSAKRKLREAQEENMRMRRTMDEMEAKVLTSLKRVQSFKDRMPLSSSSGSNLAVDVQQEIVGLENMFESFQMLAAKHNQIKGESVKAKMEISACSPSVLAREEEVI